MKEYSWECERDCEIAWECERWRCDVV